MNDVLQFFAIAATLWVVFAFMGAFIAQAKGRPAFEGVVFGFMLGPFGLLITALMPSIRKPADTKIETPSPAPVAEKPTGPRPGRVNATARDDYMADMIFESRRLAEIPPSPPTEPDPRATPRRPSGPSRGLRA